MLRSISMGNAESQVEDLLTNGSEDGVLKYFAACRDGTLVNGVPRVGPNEAVGRGDFRRSPLHIACLRHFARVVQQMIMCGGDPALLDAHERNCIHNAVLHGDDEAGVLSVLTLLIDPNHVDTDAVNRRDKYGMTPLHYAARNGLRECVEYLLSSDANPAILDPTRRTAAEHARAAQHVGVATLLEGRCIFGIQLGAPPQVGEGTSARIHELLQRDGAGDEDLRLVSAGEDGEGAYQRGMTPQKIQELKDEVVLHASELYGFPLNAAEKLLAEFHWRVQEAAEGYWADPAGWRERLGISGDLDDAAGTRGASGALPRLSPPLLLTRAPYWLDHALRALAQGTVLYATATWRRRGRRSCPADTPFASTAWTCTCGRA